MVIIKTEPRRVGRPCAKAGTVRVIPTGLLRLSPDLCTAGTFQVSADAGKKQLIISPVGPFQLFIHCRSGHLRIGPVLQAMGLLAKSVAGEYVVRPKAKGFIVDLQER